VTEPPDHAVVEDEFALLRSAQFLRLELVLSVFATLTTIWLQIRFQGNWLAYVIIGSFGATVLGMWWCLRRLTVQNVTGTVLIATAVLWGSTLVVAPLIPFGLPIMSFPMIIPLLVLGPLLERRQLVWLIGAGALAMGLVATLSLRAGTTELQDRIDEWTRDAIIISALAMRAVTISLAAWDANARRDATLVAAARSRAALRASRARLVEVGDEQRRALERDLHDGAQQQLVALVMRLRMLGNRHQDLSEEVAPLVDDLQDALESLRELAHGIYPPLLERGGLAEALPAVGRRLPQRVEIAAGEIGRYPPPIEAALYYSCLEALQNASKYAGPQARILVELAQRPDGLVASIIDDGPGFDPGVAGVGHGLQNIADRLEAIGGALQVETAPGRGTALHFTVPARPAS
jgi:signal transduction histidine kinase